MKKLLFRFLVVLIVILLALTILVGWVTMFWVVYWVVLDRVLHEDILIIAGKCDQLTEKLLN